MGYMTFSELAAEQLKPIDYKIESARSAIAAAVSSSRHRAALAFSAGKDSTVLADLIRRFFPEFWLRLHLIYGDTGVEYPECVKFWDRMVLEWSLGGRAHVAKAGRTERPQLKYESQRAIWDWLRRSGRIAEVLKDDGKLKNTWSLEKYLSEYERPDELRFWPSGTRKSYRWCTDQYGWPLLGKAFSKLMARRINIDTFLAFSSSKSGNAQLLNYYDVLKRVKISQACCLFLKKEPAKRVQRQLDVDLIFKGLLASESRSRAKNFLSRGYLFEGAKQDYLKGDPFFHCQPLAVWTDEDIWDYIRRFDVPYSPLYDMGYRDKSGTFHKIKRNGCMGCGTDLLYSNNHMAMLRRTHPRAWWVFMSGGMADEIKKLQQIFRRGQLSIYDSCSAESIMELRPCHFDSLKRIVLCDDTLEIDDLMEYDPEAETE